MELLGNKKYVELYFDSEESAMGLKGMDRETVHSYPITAGKAGSGEIHCMAFFQFFKIIPDDLTRLVPTWDPEDQILFVPLQYLAK